MDVPVDAGDVYAGPTAPCKRPRAVNQSAVQNRGTAPVAGSISAVEALAEGTHQVGYDARTTTAASTGTTCSR
ncbi:MAG: hypothetical protein ACLSVD_06175 [Eggerthellaceae bacterium]